MAEAGMAHCNVKRPGSNTKVTGAQPLPRIQASHHSVRESLSVTSSIQTYEPLKELQKVFDEADVDGGGSLDMLEFREAMRSTMDADMSDDQLDRLFMKVDTNCDGTVDWEEFTHYMLSECRGKDVMTSGVILPFKKEVQSVFGPHNDSIVRVALVPTVAVTQADNSTGHLDCSKGRYLTVSREGIVCFWSMDYKLLSQHKILPCIPGSKSTVWVTDVVALPRANLLAVATTSRVLQFYEMTSRFRRVSMVTKLASCPMALDYWSPPIIAHSDGLLLPVGILTWGDASGGISALKFASNPRQTAVNPASSSGRDDLPFSYLMDGVFPNIVGYFLPDIHADFVCQVSYLAHLNKFMSCSRDPDTAMYIGDFERNRQACFPVPKGVNSFEYMTKLNIIVGGGCDGIVRVWKYPFSSKKTGTPLNRPTDQELCSITCITVDHKRENVISMCDKDIRVYDLNTKTCIQVFYRRRMAAGLGSRPCTSMLFNTRRQTLVLATTQLAYLECADKDGGDKTPASLTGPVTLAVYNPLFQQVVSVASSSVVCVWDVLTADKVMQFTTSKVQKYGMDVEVTAMAFDPTYRRLITGADDGSVKIWNFNSGSCLRELPVLDRCLITAVVCPSKRIVTAGWNHRVTFYIDTTEEDDTIHCLRPSHRDDIISLAFYSPNLLASASYDGEILVWSLQAPGALLHRLNCQRGPKLRDPACRVPSGFYIPEDAQMKMKRNRKKSTARAEDDRDSRQATKLSDFTRNTLDLCTTDEDKERDSRTPKDQPTVKLDFTGKENIISKLMFLQARDNLDGCATLLASYSDGFVRAWSVHRDGGFLGEFLAAHQQGKSVHAMATDAKNIYLLTGDTMGYIKVWDISEYCIVRQRRDMSPETTRPPLLTSRDMSPETTRPPLLASRDMGLETTRPPLLKSLRGHLTGVTSMDFVQVHGKQFMLSASQDGSIRLWTLDGQCIGMYGQQDLWRPGRLMETEAMTQQLGPMEQQTGFLPPEICRVASPTTLKALHGGLDPNWKKARRVMKAVTLPSSGAPIAKTFSKFAALENERQSSELTPEVGLQDLSEPGSDILGRSYKPVTQHRPCPTLAGTGFSSWNHMPLAELEPVSYSQISSAFHDIRHRLQNLDTKRAATKPAVTKQVSTKAKPTPRRLSNVMPTKTSMKIGFRRNVRYPRNEGGRRGSIARNEREAAGDPSLPLNTAQKGLKAIAE